MEREIWQSKFIKSSKFENCSRHTKFPRKKYLDKLTRATTGGGFRRPVTGGMVASQGVETSSAASTTTQHHHQHHHNANEVQYCSPVHSPYGEYYPGEHYHFIQGTHPDMCPHHMHIHQGEYGKLLIS